VENLTDVQNGTRACTVLLEELVSIRNRALRRGAWFQVLSRTERAIVSLTIRCVERVRSPKLAMILRSIVSKLKEAMKSKVEQAMETTGLQLAQNLGRIAQAWGNKSAAQWAKDMGFLRYLAVVRMNENPLFR